MSESLDTIRLDIWLWRARFFKTRSLSSEYISKRGVRIGRAGQVRKSNKPGVQIAVGDILTFSRSKTIHIIEVLEFGERRGPASEAALLYRVVEET